MTTLRGWAANILGLDGNQADVDNNANLCVNPPMTVANAGFVATACENDSGSLTGVRIVEGDYSSDDYRMAVGMCTPIYDYQFTGTAQDTGQWKCTFTTMTETEGGGSLLMNANSTATASAGVSLQTWRYFKLMAGAEVFPVINFTFTATPLAHQIWEGGLFIATTTAVPGDGAYFRFTSAGLVGCVNFSGSEVTKVLLTLPNTNFVAGTVYNLGINVTTYQVDFWLGNTLLGTITTPSGNPMPFATGALPITVQFRNDATGVTGSPQMQVKIAGVHVEQDDLSLGLPASHMYAAMGQTLQGQEGGTPGSLALWPASASAAAVAGPLAATAPGNGLGGLTSLNFATGNEVLNTDYLIAAWQNPAGGLAQIPRTFICTGVQIQAAVTTVLAGGPAAQVFMLCFGSTAQSYATAESTTFFSGTTKIARKMPIGIIPFIVTAPVGTVGPTAAPLVLDLPQSPIVVNPGEWLEVAYREIGVILTSGVIVYACAFKGYFI